MEQYLPYIAAIIVAVITAYVNYRVGSFKNTIDAKALINGANEALRDDLLALVDKYEAREKSLAEKNDQLQNSVYDLRLEVNALRLENQGLKAEMQRLRDELHKFERKVYYTPGEQKI